jgi:AcrR family transcriptional regulator
MDDLARELGMSKKTLYASFPSKAALLEAALGEKFRAVEADLERITSAATIRSWAGVWRGNALVSAW